MENGLIIINYVAIKDILADGLIKPLATPVFRVFTKELDLISTTNSSSNITITISRSVRYT